MTITTAQAMKILKVQTDIKVSKDKYTLGNRQIEKMSSILDETASKTVPKEEVADRQIKKGKTLDKVKLNKKHT